MSRRKPAYWVRAIVADPIDELQQVHVLPEPWFRPGLLHFLPHGQVKRPVLPLALRNFLDKVHERRVSDVVKSIAIEVTPDRSADQCAVPALLWNAVPSIAAALQATRLPLSPTILLEGTGALLAEDQDWTALTEPVCLSDERDSSRWISRRAFLASESR